MADYAIFWDASKCTGCKGCQSACKCWNLLPSPLGKNVNEPTGSYQSPLDLNGNTRLLMTFQENEVSDDKKWGVEWSIGRRSCMHCVNPACATVCPSGALSVDEDTGFVRVQDDKCIGCQYCSGVCPFDVPRYYAGGSRINKCTACLDRVKNGGAKPVNGGTGTGNPRYSVPACVHTCSPAALDFGTREDMLAKAYARVQFLQNKPVNPCSTASVYGDVQLEGTHVIMVLKYAPETYGLPADPKVGILPTLTSWMKPLAAFVGVATIAGLGLSYITGLGYKRDTLHFDPDTEETIDMDTGEVVCVGDGHGHKIRAAADAASDAAVAAVATVADKAQEGEE
ncbi:MAG: 4Fe-4S dicluster domain-containing protein [Coriobacteriales bacterium]|jgi:formate dehydrogenase iron-sulfur subunit|nr:4Fe-4S dicluster domain-containing protein [Coriobacteriales bacterium]